MTNTSSDETNKFDAQTLKWYYVGSVKEQASFRIGTSKSAKIYVHSTQQVLVRDVVHAEKTLFKDDYPGLGNREIGIFLETLDD